MHRSHRPREHSAKTRSAARPALQRGVAGGFLGTIAMTLVMELMRRRADGSTRLPFPPRPIAMGIAEKAGLKKHWSETQRTAFTLLSHFGYGTTMGTLFHPLTRHFDWTPAMRGVAYGGAVWALSYAGWLATARIYPPPNRRPLSETAMLIAAHLVWGATLSLTSDDEACSSAKT